MDKLPVDHPLRAEAERGSSHAHALNALLAVILPIIWGALGAVTPDLWKQHGNLSTALPWLALIVVHVLVWFHANPTEKSLLKLTIENTDLRAEVAALSDRLTGAEKWVFHSVAAFSLRTMTAAYLKNGIASRDELSEALDELLSPLYLNGGEVLGLDASERWSFGIYLYSAENDVLLQVWRKKSPNHPSTGVGRSWERGQGHVGKAFVDGKVIITGDATHPDVVQLCSAPEGKEAEYDQTVYKSFASVPILPIGSAKRPYGVLVGTSDVTDRFDEDGALLLMHYAESIGVLVELGQLDFDELISKDTQSKAGTT